MTNETSTFFNSVKKYETVTRMISTPDLTFESCVTVDVNRWRIEIGVTVTLREVAATNV